jgi:hypothetical protein
MGHNYSFGQCVTGTGRSPVKPKLQGFHTQGRLARLDIGRIAGKLPMVLLHLPAAEEPRRHKPSSDSRK